MKKNLLLILGLAIATGLFNLNAQPSDPGTDNLKHQWTFDDGTANDSRTPAVNGVLMGGATIDATEKALKTEGGGQYLSLSLTDLALNQYAEITIECWAKPNNAAWNNMIFYFGDSTGGIGLKGVFQTSVSRTAISCSDTEPWAHEDNVAGRNLNDSVHQTVTVLDATGITYYIDGVLIGTKAYQTGNSIANLGTQAGMLAKGGYRADPTWPGLIYKFSIYDRALINDEILWLYQQGGGVPTKIGTISNKYSQKGYIKNNQIVVNFTLEQAADVEFEVYSVQGKLITTHKNKYSAGANRAILDANLSHGVYFVKMSFNGKYSSMKLVN
jgi:hypothetical protein